MARTPRLANEGACRPAPPITDGAALATVSLPFLALAETTNGGNAAPLPVRALKARTLFDSAGMT